MPFCGFAAGYAIAQRRTMNPQFTQNRSGQRLLLIQVLRAVAAAMIVVLHAESLVRIYAEQHDYSFAPIEILPLGAGVDLFFVISGFVIVYSSQGLFAEAGGARTFMVRRLIRILPLYWAALTLRVTGLAIAVLIGSTVSLPNFTAIITSYLFIPYDSFGYGTEYPFPVVDLGWSLNYEMFFYALFAGFICFARDRAVLLFVAAIFVLVALGSAFAPADTVLRFWTHPIIVEFAAGTMIALLFLNGVSLRQPARLLLIALGVGLWLTVQASWFTDMSPPGFYSWTRVLIWGLGATILIAAAALGPAPASSPWLQKAALLGDSSYVLYLLHPVFFLLIKGVLHFVTVPQSCLWLVVFGSAGFAIVSAAAVYRLAEAPVVKFLNAQIGKKAITAA
jgi:exopolysaccharide production protein ExoZ